MTTIDLSPGENPPSGEMGDVIDVNGDIDHTSAYRAFGVMHKHHENEQENASGAKQHKRDTILDHLRANLLGEASSFTGPYPGEKNMVYADWTASGRALGHLEQYVKEEVLPTYGNTHTTASRCGHQSTCFRHEARQVVAEAVNAKITGKAALDVVLFTGQGTTSAINKLVLALGLHVPLPASLITDPSARPVVFVSSIEHHSNLLPWREAEVDVVNIQFSPHTGVCLSHLQTTLEQYSNRTLKIGSFAAASNVTGMLIDVDAVSILMHKAGGIAVFDYATAAPYVKMDMNPVQVGGPDAALVYKDAIVFSGHKFVGGPGCPGVLVAKKRLLPPPSSAPTAPGGGTVFYVTSDTHRYLSNREEREEGGTPGIVEDIRMGLVMHLKQSIGPMWIEQRETETAQRVITRLRENPAIHLLGHPHPQTATRTGVHAGRYLPIISFLIQPLGSERCLHYNFVCTLLNDLFGIQSRGGCMCAGPFSQLLLGIPSSFTGNCSATSPATDASELDEHFLAMNSAIEDAVLDKQEVLRPGFSRLSLPFFMTEEKVDYVMQAIEWVAEKGALFLPFYRYNHRTGEYAHTTRLTKFPERKWLTSFNLLSQDSSDGDVAISIKDDTGSGETAMFRKMFAAADVEANRISADNNKRLTKKKGAGAAPSAASVSSSVANPSLNDYESVRWFLMASDFPHSLPVVSIHGTTSDLSLRRTLKGPLRPNLFLNSLDSSSLLKDTQQQYFDSLSSKHEKSLYAQKRDKKMNARSATTSAEGSSTHVLPRYAHPQDFIKDKTKTQQTITLAPITITSATDGAVSSKGNSDVSHGRPDSGSNTRNHLLGGHGVVYAAITPTPPASVQTEPSTESSSSPVSSSCTPAAPTVEKRKVKIPVPPKKLLKTVGQAISDWRMIEDGDRVVLGLSGGKDSLCMLHLLRHFQRIAPIKFTLACATVDPQTDSFDPSPLIPYVQSLGITYHYLSEPIVAMAKEKMQGDSLCAFCARFKRGLLYSCCRENNYNKLVLAQHLDDLAESFMMSALHNGQVRTMKANYPIDSADDNIRVIRPLVYTREQSTRDFSLSLQLPVINENCPACFEEPKERARMKKLLSQEESMIPSLFQNLRRALTPLMHDETYQVMHRVAAEIDAMNATKKSFRKVGGSDGKTKNAADSQKQKRSDGDESTQERNKRPKMEMNDIDTGEVDGNDDSEGTAGQKCTAEYCAPCYELA